MLKDQLLFHYSLTYCLKESRLPFLEGKYKTPEGFINFSSVICDWLPNHKKLSTIYIVVWQCVCWWEMNDFKHYINCFLSSELLHNTCIVSHMYLEKIYLHVSSFLDFGRNPRKRDTDVNYPSRTYLSFTKKFQILYTYTYHFRV